MKYVITENQYVRLIESFETKYNSFSTLNDQDLEDIAKWGLNGEYIYSGCWDDNETMEEDAVKCAIDDFKTFLSKPYPENLGNFPNEPVIYRLVRLKSLDDLNRNKLGFSWFSNPIQYTKDEFYQMLDHLTQYKNNDGELYLIKGKTPEENIDIPRTLWQRSTQWYENEIVVKDDSRVEILSVRKISDKTLNSITESVNDVDSQIKELILNSYDIDGFIKALNLKYGETVPLYHSTTPENAKEILANGFKLQEYGANYKSWSSEPNLYFQIGKSDYVADNRPVLLRIDVPLEFIAKYAYADMDTAWVDDDELVNHGVHPDTISSDMEDVIRYFIWNDMKLDGMEIIIEDRDATGEDIFKGFKPRIVN